MITNIYNICLQDAYTIPWSHYTLKHLPLQYNLQKISPVRARCLGIKKDPAKSQGRIIIWSGQGESNSHIQLGKLMFYH